MQIVTLAFGSRGDTQPQIAFAVEVCRMHGVSALAAWRDLCASHSPHAIHMCTVHRTQLAPTAI